MHIYYINFVRCPLFMCLLTKYKVFNNFCRLTSTVDGITHNAEPLRNQFSSYHMKDDFQLILTCSVCFCMIQGNTTIYRLVRGLSGDCIGSLSFPGLWGSLFICTVIKCFLFIPFTLKDSHSILLPYTRCHPYALHHVLCSSSLFSSVPFIFIIEIHPFGVSSLHPLLSQSSNNV